MAKLIIHTYGVLSGDVTALCLRRETLMHSLVLKTYEKGKLLKEVSQFLAFSYFQAFMLKGSWP